MNVNVKDRKWIVNISEEIAREPCCFATHVGVVKVRASTALIAVDKALAAAKIYWEGCCLVPGSVSCEDVLEIDLTEEEGEDKKLEKLEND